MQSYTYDEIQIGQEASVAKTISEYDVYTFTGLIGDFNPVHINTPHAEGTFFKERIAHGMLIASFVSTVLGMYLPGPGCVLISNAETFLAPVRFGDTITVTCKVVEKLDKNRVKLESRITNQRGEVVVTGESLVSIPKTKK
ncbi:MAG: MaoC family dehydratase [Lachnospiraceae bacterium]|nr:MaoC family dehydratase [Lachnospiraceae bacterium]